MSLNRLVTVAALAMTLVFAAFPMPAARAGGNDCAAMDPLCFDRLPRDDTWERAIRLSAVPYWWEGDGVAVASIDTGVTPNRDLGSRMRAAPRLHFGRRRHRPLRPRDPHRRPDREQRRELRARLRGRGAGGRPRVAEGGRLGRGDRREHGHRGPAVGHVEPRQYGIRVVNLSWGTDGAQPADVDPLDAAVERAWRAGLVVVVSAGNTAGSVTKPGDDPHVITVGAADIAGTAATTTTPWRRSRRVARAPSPTSSHRACRSSPTARAARRSTSSTPGRGWAGRCSGVPAPRRRPPSCPAWRRACSRPTRRSPRTRSRRRS